jgi:hypothetical protein
VWVDPGPEKKLIIKLGPTVIEETWPTSLSRCSALQAGVFRCHQDQTRIEEIAEDLLSKAIN